MNGFTPSQTCPAPLLDEKSLHMLHWRSRRGLLENDLFIEKFFERYGHSLTTSDADAMTALMNLADNDLLDLVLRRTELQEAMQTPAIQKVLEMLRESRPQS
ncbi:antitoxin CptB [Lampropedia hyalina DSM 16112]|jgi:antitoxin CptB|uniref:FAD assembly factor SdhE n=1 Tax=Lampropedia hyalina DSM 16112 TaxID=1122156 RepID=A0A1M4UMT4_9BURK|nr:succinate dehydrogenase assembly factor 2 [Lampropedia hyalina]SHE57994.1 antitoxin CptB [Lampropedia hyalina DSM 16112]